MSTSTGVWQVLVERGGSERVEEVWAHSAADAKAKIRHGRISAAPHRDASLDAYWDGPRPGPGGESSTGAHSHGAHRLHRRGTGHTHPAGPRKCPKCGV